MSSGIRHVQTALLMLVMVFVVGVAGYCIAGWDLVDSIYMVVIILSTVGLEEVHQLSPEMELFTSIIIVVGVSTALYLMGAFVQMMTEGEVNRVLGLRKISRDIKRLNGHVVICGFGRMGEILAGQLRNKKKTFVIVEKSPERIAEATELGYLAVSDDATEENALESVGVAKAATLVTTLPHDADNVFIALTARNLNPDIHIIARGEFQSTEKKLIQAGADRVVLPAATGAMRMAAMITRPSMVELVELVAGSHVAEVEVDEVALSSECKLVGKTLGQSDIRSRHGLLVVAVRRGKESLQFAPGANLLFEAEDRVVVIGPLEDIERFRREHGL
ncbi:MAG: potassium channel protein [Pirellulales bacterium]|nr:potassium channel protein [Pirellulales bacterium]